MVGTTLGPHNTDHRNAESVGELARATGHCSHLLPFIAAGMDAKEHIGIGEPRGNTYMYDDLIQLFRAAGVAVAN